MATVTVPQAIAIKADPDSRFVLYNVGWDGYEAMLQIVGDRPIRLTYDQGNLELMSPSQPHEKNRELIGLLVVLMAMELEIPCETAGSTTWRRQTLDRGLEADACYFLFDHAEYAKERTINLNIDPPPDLAIEIETSRSAFNRRAIYAALGVPELWRFDGERLIVERLRPDGTYEACAHSPAFPFLPLDEVVRLVKEGESMVFAQWGRMVQEWVRNELRPRYPQQP